MQHTLPVSRTNTGLPRTTSILFTLKTVSPVYPDNFP